MFRRLLFGLVLLCLPTLANAVEVPYSGQLTENGALVTGNRYVALNIYATPTGGTPLQPTQAESLSVVNGVYHTMLNAPNTIWDGTDRYIGVSINSGPELTPRVKVGWVPYAVYTPHAVPWIFPAPVNSRTVTSNQWSRADSVIVTVTNPGFVVVSVLGYVQPTGSGLTTLQLDLSTATPTDFATYYSPVPLDGNSKPLTMTTVMQVPAGQTKIYLWTKLGATGGPTYYVDTKKFQALYIPK